MEDKRVKNSPKEKIQIASVMHHISGACIACYYLWYTCVKMIYISRHFFIFSKFWFFRFLGGERAENGKNFCMSHFISQESYIIWLCFSVHMHKTMIYPGIFFNFFKIVIWNHAPYLRNCRSYHHNNDYAGVFLYFLKKYNIVNVKIIYIFYLPTLTVFLINSCFSNSSINAEQQFWGVPHLLHMCVIFVIILVFIMLS